MSARSSPAVVQAALLVPLGRAADAPRPLRLPLSLSHRPAGFPSPAEDYVEAGLELNDLLIRRPAATFFLRVVGDSMTGAGIHGGDLLIVDRSLAADAAGGTVIVACIDGQMTVKRLRRRGRTVALEAANPAYPPLVFDLPDDECEDGGVMVWGVVLAVIHKP